MPIMAPPLLFICLFVCKLRKLFEWKVLRAVSKILPERILLSTKKAIKNVFFHMGLPSLFRECGLLLTPQCGIFHWFLLCRFDWFRVCFKVFGALGQTHSWVGCAGFESIIRNVALFHSSRWSMDYWCTRCRYEVEMPWRVGIPHQLYLNPLRKIHLAMVSTHSRSCMVNFGTDHLGGGGMPEISGQ